ncbi:MAG TPA: DEAD/DEAH box helicase [Streptosporangiaceae bacterium]|nr:DEAD/DEAH box helicase [Streptosporangiaceae bacterium]
MRHAQLQGIDPDSLARAAGGASYARGLAYFRQGAVARVWWDSSRSALAGSVRGSGGQLYSTTAFFLLADDLPPQFEDGRCSCPVSVNCKHVVALVLAGSDAGLATAAGPVPAPRVPGPPAGPQAPSWEQSLEALLGPAAAADPAQDVPLAVELTLAAAGRPGWTGRARWPVPAGPGAAGAVPSGVAGAVSAGIVPQPQPLRLQARLVQPGRNGGWIAGSLSWSRLDSLAYQGSYAGAQVRVLQELYALYHSRAPQRSYYGAAGEEKSIDLSAFESAQLWPVLDRARAAGVALLHGRGQPATAPGGAGEPDGTAGPYRTAELVLDVTRRDPAGPLTVTPQLRAGAPGAAVRPLTFIGSEGHGLVYVEPADAERTADYASWPFGLARLERPVPPALQQLALSGQPLEIPADGLARFREEYCPRLQHAATLVSSDGSFAPPQISGPTLVLSVTYGDGHVAEVGWDWSYEVGSVTRRTPLRPDGTAGFRDLAAERALLTGLDLPLGRFGLLCHAPAPRQAGTAAGAAAAAGAGAAGLAERATLRGIDTMRLCTELLPLLASQPGVRLEVAGTAPDYRAVDDSLTIGVSTSEVAGDADWFDLKVIIIVAGHEIPFTDVFLALSRGESCLLLDDGAYFSLDKPELAALSRLIEEARALQDTPRAGLRISRYQAGLWEELTEIGVVQHQALAWERQVQGLLAAAAGQPAGGPGDRAEAAAATGADPAGPAEPPPALAPLLRPYQLDGFRWLAFLWRCRLGGILADDMGLGKTLQSLALIEHARQAEPGMPPFLIVAPTSVVHNWAAESARFTPGLAVAAVTETTARRGRPLAEVIAGADVVVTSYALLRIDCDHYAGLDWSGLILDEAQFAKNHQSKVYQCARRVPAPFKLAITGTPMENNLMELWSLLSITAPGLFPSPGRFRDFYARPIENGRQAELLGQLRRRIRPLMMRRTKELVAVDLPAKQEQILEVELAPRHRRIYQTHLQRERQKILGLIGDLNEHRFAILRSLTLLRQLSLHAGLVDDEHAALPSAKLDALAAQLRDVIGGGHRALVFSQFTGFLRMAAARLDADGVPYCYLDGRTRDRDAVIRQFREDAMPVFLISLRAGGFGLNLTEADYCFLLDPWWNPATEAQAVDRTHRIGQDRNVMVYRLISAGTIEEKVLALQQRKAELFASVMDSGNAFGAALTADDIRALLD